MTQLAQGETRTFGPYPVTDTDIVAFAAVSGDHNPIHVDEAAGRASRFGRRVAHGLLSVGRLSGIYGTVWPGPGTLWSRLGPHEFRAPVYPGDEVTVTLTAVTVVPTRSGSRFVEMGVVVTNQDGATVIEGGDLLWLPPAEG